MRRIATVVSVALVAAFVLAAPASALICAWDPELTPAKVVDAKLTTGISYSKPYDFAVVGTVTSITTDTVTEGAYGRTEIGLDVALWVGGGNPSPHLVVTANDPGWMSGWPYKTGDSYFIPVLVKGPGGQPNYSFLCDPIFEVDDTTQVALELVPVAESVGLDHTLYSTPPGETPDEAPEPDNTVPPGQETPTGDQPTGPEADEVGTLSDVTVPWSVVVATTGAIFLLLVIVWRAIRRQQN